MFIGTRCKETGAWS